MNMKYLVVVSLILAILTIGFVSASDDISDDCNLTESPGDDAISSSVEEIELEADDTGDVVGEEDEKISNYTYQLQMRDSYIEGSHIQVYGQLPDDAYGYLTVDVDGESIVTNDEVYRGYVNVHIEEFLSLANGTHFLKLNYTGDSKYQDLVWNKTFTVEKVMVNFPDEIEIGGEYDCQGHYPIETASQADGNITISFDGELYKSGSFDDLIELEYWDIRSYHVPVSIDHLSYGQHTYEVTYWLGGEKTTKTGVFNVTYLFEVYSWYFEEDMPYGTEENLTVYLPYDVNGTLCVSINGRQKEYVAMDKNDIPIENVAIGVNNITVTYGDAKYPLKSKDFKVNVIGKIQGPEDLVVFNDGEGIFLELPSDATGQLCVYKISHDEYLNEVYGLVGNVTFSNGRAFYTIDSGLGDTRLLARYENGNYNVANRIFYFTLIPCVDYSKSAALGSESNLTIQVPDGSTGTLTVKVYASDIESYYDEDCDLISVLYSGQIQNVNITLDTSNEGYYLVKMDYGFNSQSFLFHVIDANPEWNLVVNFPKEILSTDVSVYPTVNYPKGAVGRFTIYIDGVEAGSDTIDPHENTVELWGEIKDHALGVHTWRIDYGEDPVFNDASQNGTFNMTWAIFPDVVFIGEDSNYVQVGLKGCDGNVKLNINGQFFCETPLEYGKAEIDLGKNWTPGTGYTYEITCNDLIKSGCFDVDFKFDAYVDDPYDYIIYLQSNDLYVLMPEGITGTVMAIVGSSNYSAEIGDNGIAVIPITLAWGKNNVTITYLGNGAIPSKTITRVFEVSYCEVMGQVEDGKLKSVSLMTLDLATGNLTVLTNGDPFKTIRVENGYAFLDLNDLPVGCYYVYAYYDEYDVDVGGYSRYVSIAPDVNLTDRIYEGQDCIVDIYLANSTSEVNMYIDGEFYQTYVFDEGRLKITLSNLALANHTLTFIYLGGDYSNPFSYYDEDDYCDYQIPYHVEVCEKSNPNFNMVIENVDNETPITVRLTADGNFTGNVVVKIAEYDVVVCVDAGEGINATDITLPVGNYTATLNFTGSAGFNAQYFETAFNVTEKPSHYDADLKVNVENIDLGGNATVYITISDKAEGFVVVKVTKNSSGMIVIPGINDDSLYNRTFNVEIINGKCSLTITDLVENGKYDVVASYEGDGLVLSDEASASFNVLDDADLKLQFEDIVVGEDFIVNITMNYNEAALMDIVDVEVTAYDVSVKSAIMSNGKGKVNFTGLEVGQYSIKARFKGDDYYRACEVNGTFRVKPLYRDTSMNISVENITSGEDAVVTVNIDKTATGNIIVTVGDKNQSKSINAYVYIEEPGQYNFTFSDLASGTHEVTVNFTGTPENFYGNGSSTIYHNPAFKTTSIYVKPIPVSANLSVSADEEVYESQKVTVRVLINETATGNVTININGKNETIRIENGKGTYMISNLAAGNYSYNVTFEGDEYFLSDTKTVTFKVKPNNARIEIVNDVNEYSNGVFTFRLVSNVDNSNLSNVSINLIVLGNISLSSTKTTDENGIASFKTSLLYEVMNDSGTFYRWILNVGKHPVEVRVSSESLFADIIKTNLTITPAHIKIGLDDYEEDYGGDKNVTFTVSNVNGEALTNTVLKVEIPQISQTYYVTTDGNGTAQLSVKELYKGNYSIKISNNDTKNIVNESLIGNFTIRGWDAGFSVNASDVFVGDDVTVKVSVNRDFNGNVTINVAGENKPIDITDGEGKYILSNLEAGDYSFNVTYGGDLRYAEGTAVVSFKVIRKAPDFTVTVADVVEGTPITVEVTANANFTGVVSVNVGENDILVSVSAGSGVNVTDIVLPAADNYVATLAFDGDDRFNAGNAETTFNVTAKPKVDPDFAIIIADVEEGTPITVEVTANANFTGVVSVNVGENDILVSVSAGSGVNVTDIVLPAADNYVASLAFGGDDRFNAGNAETTFNVTKKPKYDANLSVSAADVFRGQNVLVVVSINETATGNITISIGGEDKIIQIIDGKGNYTISNLPGGDYEYTISYSGDDCFSSDSKTVSFKVAPYNARIEIINDVTEFKSGNFTFKVLSNIDNTTLNNVMVQLKVIGRISAATTVTTDENGIATFKIDSVNKFVSVNGGISMLPLEVGKHPVELSIPESGIFAENVMSNLTITPAHIKITLDNYEEYYGSDKNLTFTVTNVNGEILTYSVFKVEISGAASDAYYVLTDGNGISQVSVSKFYRGSYEIKISNNDTENIVNESLTGSFTVKGLDAGFTVNASDAYVGENATVIVKINRQFGGYVAIDVGGENKFIEIIDGEGKYVFSNLGAGDYTFNVTYGGDLRYDEGMDSVSFKINRKSPDFSIAIANVEEGNPITVEVAANADFTGDVIVKVGENDVMVSVKDGKGSNVTGIVLPVANDYAAVLNFTGNDEFGPYSAETTFNVTKKPKLDPDFEISIADVQEGIPITVKVTANANFTGDVVVRIADNNITVSIKDGNGTNDTNIVLSVADNYTATLNFAGNDMFNAGSDETTFTVFAKPAILKIDPSLTISIANITEGENAVILITTNISFTGSVLVQIGQRNITVDVNEGRGSQTVADLSAGTYTAVATFKETAGFNESIKNATFTVKAKSSGNTNGSGNQNTNPSGNSTNTKVPAKIVANDLTAYYSCVKYSVTVYGTDGKVAKGVKVTFKVNGKKIDTVKTNKKGIATIKLKQTPKTYKITSEALGLKVTKTLKVKNILKLKTIKVRQSTKKLYLKATLKAGKKAIKGKKVTFKVNGKKVGTAKTNKKGLAKIKIKKSLLNKIKNSDKVKYLVTYLAVTVKKTAKVEK